MILPTSSDHLGESFLSKKFNNCIAKREVGCLKHPGGSAISCQLLAEDCSHTIRETGTHHAVETVERGRERGVGGELPGRSAATLQNARERLLYAPHATIHKHMEFRHMLICVDSIKHLTAFKSKRFPGCHCENQLLSCRKH